MPPKVLPMSRGTGNSFDEELARARLAFISAGQHPLGEPRRAVSPTETGVVADGDADGGAGEPPLGRDADRSRRSWPAIRLAITSRQAIAVLVLLLCGVGVTVAALGRSSATQLPVDPVPSLSALPPASPPEPSPSPSLRVHVLGAVVAPGVVTLPPGSIVQDAVFGAGGLREDADPAELNLAAPMFDGQQVIVGTTADPRGEVHEQPASTLLAQPGALINLNTATSAELEALPGVGPVLAGAIVAWRDEHGSFTTVSELQEVAGIGPKSYEKLEPLVTT